jgi:hypothetical protein
MLDCAHPKSVHRKAATARSGVSKDRQGL